MTGWILRWSLGLVLLAGVAFGEPVLGGLDPQGERPRVLMQTTLGDVIIELYPDKAPVSVENFLGYVEEGFYDGTIMHRVVRDFVIQGGGYTPRWKEKPTQAPIPNEAGNGLRNRRGAVAVARPVEPDSGTSQFFISVVDNRMLDHQNDTVQGYGYAVFGRVVQGMKVVDRINQVPTGKRKEMRDVPLDPVIVKRIILLDREGDDLK